MVCWRGWLTGMHLSAELRNNSDTAAPLRNDSRQVCTILTSECEGMWTDLFDASYWRISAPFRHKLVVAGDKRENRQRLHILHISETLQCTAGTGVPRSSGIRAPKDDIILVSIEHVSTSEYRMATTRARLLQLDAYIEQRMVDLIFNMSVSPVYCDIFLWMLHSIPKKSRSYETALRIYVIELL